MLAGSGHAASRFACAVSPYARRVGGGHPDRPTNDAVEVWQMSLGLLLIVIGIVLAIFVHYLLGIAVILVGLVILIAPRISGGGARV